MPGMSEFVERRKGGWSDLAQMVLRAGNRGGIRRLTRDELRRLGPLYRRAAADLAFVRLRGADPALIDYLNDLVTRAHGLLYAERGPGLVRLWHFLLLGFPSLLRRRMGYIVAAAALFWIGAGFSAALTAVQPRAASVFLGGFEGRDQDKDFYKDLPERMSDKERPEQAAFLMTHNTQVAILAFASGILGGFPTLIYLCFQGMPLGVIAVAQHRAGYDLIFWSFIVPHGVPELTAIFIAGGAGMCIGHALIAPGDLTRSDAMKVAGRDAIRLLLGSVALFIIAGFTESFVSPTALPAAAKLTYGALMAAMLIGYLRLGAGSR